MVSDRFWFKVQIITENYSTNMNVDTKAPLNLLLSSMKRNTDEYIFSNKKQKTSKCDEPCEHSECDMEIQRYSDNNDTCNDKVEKQNSHNLNNEVMSVNLVPEKLNNEISENVPSDSNDTKKQSGDKDVDKQNIEPGTEAEDRSLKDGNKGQAINPRRDRCWYGQECYRSIYFFYLLFSEVLFQSKLKCTSTILYHTMVFHVPVIPVFHEPQRSITSY